MTQVKIKSSCPFLLNDQNPFMCPYNTLKEWEVKSMAFLPNNKKVIES
jgi:hypothetical protein